MAPRKVVFANNEIYHIYNIGVNHQPIFNYKRDYQRGLMTISFYQHFPVLLSLSRFLNLSLEDREKFKQRVEKQTKKLVEIFSFCLMPNHFHFLLKQKKTNGISTFLSNFQNSYTRYFNLRHQRTGHLFQGQFKAVRIETDDQLIHVARYIHLNPHTSYIVKTFKQLKKYPWSSLPEYLESKKDNICNKKTLLSYFSSLEDFEDFIFNQKDYQRELQAIRHLSLEE